MTENVLTPTVWIDVPMPVDYVDIKLIKQFEKLQPFGKGNENRCLQTEILLSDSQL